jgi:metal-responsive CopG/Arc/MetJ family transcriptional regulator
MKDRPKLRRDGILRGERITIYMPKAVATALRVRCARQRRSRSDAITVAVQEWLRAR